MCSHRATLNAAYSGNIEIMEVLIKAGVNIEIPDSIGRTPLMYAASRGNVDILYLLISKGADIYRYDNKGLTAFEYALASQNKHAIEPLQKAHFMQQELFWQNQFLTSYAITPSKAPIVLPRSHYFFRSEDQKELRADSPSVKLSKNQVSQSKLTK